MVLCEHPHPMFVMYVLFYDYRQIEGKVVEISKLQEIFADKVLEQVSFKA